MANFNSTEPGSARFILGGGEQQGTGWGVLLRLQEALRAFPWREGEERIAAYRSGGPIGRENTRFAPQSIRSDANHGAVTNAALWLATARILFPNASVEDLTYGRAITDPARRNVLDKIEQSLVDGRIHPTALEAALLVIGNARGERTANSEDFIARRGPRLLDSENRAALQTWPLNRAMPAPRGLAARLLYPVGTPLVQRTFLVTMEACPPIGEAPTTSAIIAHMSQGVTQLGTPQGISPRITRSRAATLEACFVAAWPVTVDTPDPSQFSGLNQRIDLEFARALESGFLESGVSIAALPFNPAQHGPLSFWTSGDAARTATRDETNLVASDNPLGPDALQPQRSLRDLGSIALDVGPVVAAGATLAIGLFLLNRSK